MLTTQRVRRLPMTKEEYFKQAEVRENCIVDWEHGEAIQMTPAHGRHGFFIARLFGLIDRDLEETGRGRLWQEVFVDLGDVTYGADIVVLFSGYSERYKRGRLIGPPDIVVEVLSDDSMARDRTTKLEAYHAHGVPWYWIGDPLAGTLEEYQHTIAGYLRVASGTLETPFHPHALPGLVVELGRLIESEE